MSLISDFVNWWKAASARASAEHYDLRFEANEINEIRGGWLAASANEKIRLRIANARRMTAIVLIGCLLPVLLFVAVLVAIIGFSILNSPARIGVNPVSICFGAFAVFWIAAFAAIIAVGAIKLRNFRRNLVADLHNNRVAVEQGRVRIKLPPRRSSSSRIEYRINDVLFQTLNDAIGTEIHRHFSGGAFVGRSRETTEEYRFYYLPQSKLLLHFEAA